MMKLPMYLMCRVFEVSKSGYHAWLKRKPSKRSQENARLELAIRAVQPGNLWTEPVATGVGGISAGLDRIKRLRRKLGLS